MNVDGKLCSLCSLSTLVIIEPCSLLVTIVWVQYDTHTTTTYVPGCLQRSFATRYVFALQLERELELPTVSLLTLLDQSLVVEALFVKGQCLADGAWSQINNG